MRFARVFLLTFALAAPAFAQSYTGLRPRLHFGVEGGTARTSSYYDNDGERQEADETVLGLNHAKVWGRYDLAHIGDMSVGLGASFDMADQRTELGGTTIRSGFQPRNAGFEGYITTPAYGLRGGYLLDVGEQGENASGDVTLANSDGVDAVFLGAMVQGQATRSLRIFGGADYHLTLGQDVERVVQTLPFLPPTVQRANVDPGDQLDAYGGIGFRFGGVEVGTKVHFQLVTEDKVNDTVNENTDGNSVSLIPFLTFSQPGTPFKFWIEGAGQREYGPLGIGLSGKNLPAGELGVTLGLKYGF